MRLKFLTVLGLITLMTGPQVMASCHQEVDPACLIHSEQLASKRTELGVMVADLMREKGYCFVNEIEEANYFLKYKNGCWEYSNRRCTEGRAELTMHSKDSNRYYEAEGVSHAFLGFVGRANGRLAIIRAVDKLPNCGKITSENDNQNHE